MTEIDNHPHEQPLESWKEIAAYLKRDVRTVIRWEKSEGLPVHRQMHQARGSVFAYPSELEAWKGRRELRFDAAPLITPWRRAVSAVAFALTILLALVTMSSGPIHSPAFAAGGEGSSGAVLRQIKFDGLEKASWAQLSPDGKKMLYVRGKEDEPPISQFVLRIMDLSSGQDQSIVADFSRNAGSRDFKWSPDGSHIVYRYKGNQLRVISATGGESRLVWSSSDPKIFPKPLDWSRDGQSILVAVIDETEWTTRLAVLPAEGGEPRFVVRGKRNELDDFGRFSPDGEFIVGHRTEGGNTDIYVWAVDNGRETRVTDQPGLDVAAGWSPDGKYLVFMSDRAKTLDLWAVSMSEGEPRGTPFRVRQDLGKNALVTGFTAAGQLTMVVAGEGTPSDLLVLPVDPSTGEARGEFAPFAKYPTGGFSLRWSPDGKRIAYTSRKGQMRMPSIFVNSLEGKEEQEIRVEGCYVVNVEWSPDGRHLLFPGVQNDGYVDLFRVSLEDRQITPLHLGGRRGPGYKGGFVNLQWLPGANKFIFERLATANSEGFDIYTMNSDGKQVQLVAEKVPTSIWTWNSPDGRQVAYRQGQDLKLLNLADKSSMTLTTFPPGKFVSGPAWSPDARRIAFTDTRQLRVRSVGESTSKVLVEAPGGLEMGDLPLFGGTAWSPDGSRIAYLLQEASKAAGGKSELWVVPSAGGRPQRIAAAPASHPHLSNVVWHPSGDMIVATGDAADEQNRSLQYWVLENFLPVAKAAH
jgi:Tol biopolymer transport system component